MKALELRQKRAKLITEMSEVSSQASKEARSMNSEEQEKFKKMFADEKALRSTIEAIEATEGLQRSLEATQEVRARENGSTLNADSAFEQFIRSAGNVSAEVRSHLISEQRTSTGNVTSSGAAGGYMVPQGFYAQLVEAMKYVGGPFQVATIINTESGNPLPMPVLDDTSNASAIVSEASAIAAVDMVNAQVLLNAFKYPAEVKLSLELLADNGINIQAKLADILGKRIARGMNADFTNGAGTSSPKGFLKSGTAVTGSSATDLSYGDLVKLKYSVDRAYRTNGTWQMNDTTFAALVQLHDTQNRPLIFPASAGADELLFGQKVIINNDMPSIGSTSTVKATPIAYGDFNQYYVRQVNGTSFRVLSELYAGSDLVGFRASQRVDGRLAVAAAVKFLEQPVSA